MELLLMPSKQQLDSFYEFAAAQIHNGGAALSMDEVYCLWRAKHPTPAEVADSVAAIRSAYADLAAGEQGRLAREALRETCERLGLVIDE
jgi:hypothetical protein